MAASKGVGNNFFLCVCSSASKIPSQLRHLREILSISVASKVLLLSASLSGKLYRDFSGDAVFDDKLLEGN